MTRPVNIYSLSRIHSENEFNIVKKHQVCDEEPSRIKYHEIESLRLLVDRLVRRGVPISGFAGFFYSYHIPQIGKEFDLLKFTEDECLNIELKSDIVPDKQILDQLRKNKYYLRHTGKSLQLYSVVTKDMTCYKLSLTDELEEVEFEEVYNAVRRVGTNYLSSIDTMFRASDYLVSPINDPDKFVKGEYFLTPAQEQIKNSILKTIDTKNGYSFLHLTGKPGTGKTLLLYDIAKTLANKGKTLIFHCGKLSKGQEQIIKEINQLTILSVIHLKYGDYPLEMYDYVLVDEAHRIYPYHFAEICKSVAKNDQACLFSSDSEQVLSITERENNIERRIKDLQLEGEYQLSEKIRTNKNLCSFIMRMMDLNHKPKKYMDYSCVEINYANTTKEVQLLLEYYRGMGYVFINYSKSNYWGSPYSEYTEDFDTHHVIGQEFDKVVMLMDESFYYTDDGILQGIPHPNPNYLYPNLFYLGITRVRETLALIV